MSKKEVSSGAEKAEKIAKTPTKKSTSTKTPTKSTPKKPTARKTTAKPAADKKEEKRLLKAKIRAEKKQHHLEKRLEAKQRRLDRLAQIKENREKRRSERKERKETLRHESREAKRERILLERQERRELKAQRRAAHMEDRLKKREHRLKMREQKRNERKDKRHAPGFGGWLAAVISLGVTTLALGTMLTYGWITMNGMQTDMTKVHTQSLYELNSIVDNLDSNLSKARVATTTGEQVKLLSDITVESRTAEMVLERLPMDVTLTNNMTNFINKVGDSSQSMLKSVAAGKKLTESQTATIEHMYATNSKFKSILNELCLNCQNEDIVAAMRGKGGVVYSSFGEMENTSFETPKSINDGPFAENIDRVNAKALESLDEISSAEAEKLASGYFADYKVSSVNCYGETIAEQLELFNLSIMTEDGEMNAQLSKKGGKVVEFNSFKDCSDKRFSVENCIEIGTEFLNKLGYQNMKAVWASENGTTCNLNFAYEQDGVVVYSDLVKVKVCEERGIVTGMEGLSYVLNHTQRELSSPKMSKDEAQANLAEGFQIKGSRICLMPTDGGETLAYEFVGNYGDSTYYVYVDAATGNQIEVFTVIGTAQGKALM